MTSQLFHLSLSDSKKTLLMAVLGGFALPVDAAFHTPGFSLFTANWDMILNLAINGAVLAGATYLFKNFLSDSSGKFAGVIG